MYEYGTFIKNVLNRDLLKICILILLTLSHFCACFALMVMDMDQNILDRFSHHNYLTEHSVYVLSAVEGFSTCAPPPPFSDCDCVSIFCSRVSGSNMHHSSSNSSITDDKNRGVAVEKLENMKKWGINTYKVAFILNSGITENDARTSSVWCLTVCVLFAVVYKTNDLRALRPGFPDRGPGAGGPDRGAARH